MAIHYALSQKMYEDIFIKNACFVLGVELAWCNHYNHISSKAYHKMYLVFYSSFLFYFTNELESFICGYGSLHQGWQL